jgi:hypothetical protein
LAQANGLMEAGADYVSMPRLHEARDLLTAVRAATENLLEAKQNEFKTKLADRREVLG